jgi:hypothetical protein
MSAFQISGKAQTGLELGAFKVKNTFLTLEQISQAEDETGLDVTFEFARFQSEPVLANRQFGRMAMGHAIVEADEGLDDCCAKTVGCSTTAETLDECGAEDAESDPSSDTETEPDGFIDSPDGNDMSNNQPDAFDLPKLPGEIARQTSAWSVASGGPCRQTTDFSDSGGFELSVPAGGLCRQVTEQMWPSTSDRFSWQAGEQSGLTTSNGLYQQPTNQSWPAGSNLGKAMASSATAEQGGAADNLHVGQMLTEAMPPCVAVMQMPMMPGMAGIPLMWPGMPGMQMMPQMPVRAWLPAGEYVSAQPNSRRRNTWRKSKSLVTLAQEAQQQKRQEQQLIMQQQVGALRAACLQQIRTQQQQLEQKPDKSAQEELQTRDESEQDKSAAMASPTNHDSQKKCVPKFCEHCGKGILPSFKFCQFCGASTAKTFAAYGVSAPDSS